MSANPVQNAEKVARLLRQQNRYPYVNVIESAISSIVKTEDRRKVNFLSNSFLGLCNHPRIIKAMKKGLDKFGSGAGSSRLVCTQRPHIDLEREIAKFKGRESAIVFSTGMLANLGTIPALASSPMYHLLRQIDTDLAKTLFPPVSLFIDKLNHACIYDGAALAEHNLWGGIPANVYRYAHRDVNDLNAKLEADIQASKSKGVDRSRIIITDGVFSIHGRLAPLDQIVNLAKQFNAAVYVDDAHGTGVLGATGRGTAELFQVDNQIDVPMGTLSKALGSAGGYVAGSHDFCDYLRAAARTYMFQTAMSPSNAMGLIEAIRIVDDEPERRIAVLKNGSMARQAITSIGLSTLDSEHHIVPVLIGDELVANEIACGLSGDGVLVGCIMYPAVPQGEAILRCNMMTTHTDNDIDLLIQSLEKRCRKHGII